MIEEKIVELLDQLAIKLGVTSGKVWEWALLDIKVTIVEHISFLVGFMLFCFIQYKLWKKYSEKVKEKFRELVIILIMINFFCLCYSIGCILDLPSLIVNPEWNAFQNILRQLDALK